MSGGPWYGKGWEPLSYDRVVQLQARGPNLARELLSFGPRALVNVEIYVAIVSCKTLPAILRLLM